MGGYTARGVGSVVVAGALVLVLLPGQAGDAAAASGEPVSEVCPEEVGERRFGDVDAASVHASAVDCAAWWGIAKGVAASRYNPRGEVNRAQMASFVARLIRGSGGPLPASPADAFGDDDGSVHHYAINRLAAVDVVQGRGDGTYGPGAPVTRGQMASFLVRTVEQRTGQGLTATRDHFADDDGSVHEEAINKAAEAGLALGIAHGRFHPRAPVTRAQMASFLVRGLGLVVDAGYVPDSPDTLRAASALRTFEACDELLGHLKEEGLELVGPYGFDGGGFLPPPIEWPTDGEQGAPPGVPGAPGTAPLPAVPGVDFSDTNTQEEGVDEADIVKTDGRQLLTLADGRLRRIDVSGDLPVPAGSLDVGGYGSELLLAADRALVLGRELGNRPDGTPDAPASPSFPGSPYDQAALLSLVDVGQNEAMRVAATLEVDGYPLTARMVDGVARVLVRSSPMLPFTFPDYEGPDPDPEASATRRNREVVESSTIGDWLPAYTRRDAAGAIADEGPLVGCDQVARPPEFSGLDLLSVVTVDLAGDFDPDASAAVLATGQTVYASPTGLYVATGRWDFLMGRSSTDATTEIHAFDISDPRSTTYTASGKVEGFTLNQFALSEHAGVLRVATTSERFGAAEDAESQVIVLQARGSTLEEIGRVGGLGRGESIQAVRFIGDVGYVVTYRQVDPLYTIDLSDPTAPAVRGELKILGYSAYLHPVGDGLLLGVGVDADDTGRRLGTQVALFDVTDPADPRRLHQATVAGGSSEVEFDHRAFLWWEPTGRAFLPLYVFSFDEETGGEDGFVGVAAFDVDAAAGIRDAGRVDHVEGRGGDGSFRWTPEIRRSVVVGDALYTLSEGGLKASDLSTLAGRAWLPFD